MTKNPRPRSVWFLMAIGIAVAISTVVAVAVIYERASETDYQNAFFRSLTTGVAGGIVALIFLQLAAARSGHGRVLPLTILAAVIIAIALLRFEGFSGEMHPRFAWRWSGDKPPPMETTATPSTLQSDLGSPTNQAVGPAAETANAFQQSVGFLGNRRDGTFTDRYFRVPKSDSEVEVLWNIGVGSGWSSFAVRDGLAVTLEQRDQEEWITAYDLQSGSLVWKHVYPAYHDHPLGGEGPRSTPTIDGPSVFAMGVTGRLTCLNLRDGQVVWSADLNKRQGWTQEEAEQAVSWGRAASPLIIDGLCIVPAGGPDQSKREGRSLIALDAATGQTAWKRGGDQISYASAQWLTFDSPEDIDSNQIVIVNEASITGHRLADGKRLWKFPWRGRSNANANCTSVVPAGESRFLIGKGYGGGSALVRVEPTEDGWQAEPVWESNRLMKTKFNHPVVRGDVAYGISNGALEAVRLSNGERLWLQPRRGRYGQGQVLLADDVLIVQAEEGDVAFVEANPQAFVELFRMPALDSKTWNIPTLAGRYLLVRNDREAICFRLPEIAPRTARRVGPNPVP